MVQQSLQRQAVTGLGICLLAATCRASTPEERKAMALQETGSSVTFSPDRGGQMSGPCGQFADHRKGGAGMREMA